MIPVALAALLATASADTGTGDLPSSTCPALAAAPLVYVLVPNPLGAKTWAETQVERVRLDIGGERREDASPTTTYVLLALHAPRNPGEYALEMMEAPRDVRVRAPPGAEPGADPAMPLFAEGRMIGAFEAIGLRPEELVEEPEMPAAAIAIADAIAALSRFVFRQPVREREGGPGALQRLRVDPDERYKAPGYIRHAKPMGESDPAPKVMIFAKRAVRSVYKILLGIAIGILIWGFVRNTPS